MACCSIKRPARTSWASLVLVCVPLQLLGAPLHAALWLPSLLLAGLQDTRTSLGCLLIRNRRVMDDRLRALRWRCVVAGRLLPRAPRLAGLVFRGFYPALAVSAWLCVVGVLGALALGPWILG